MKTKVLYYDDIYQNEFNAKVIDSYEKDGLYYTMLDVTAFYPEGGGMSHDKGKLNGIEIINVIKKDGEIYHVSAEEISGDVKGEVDLDYRMLMIQDHDAQHLLTGIFEGDYNLVTVSHHIHEDFTSDIYLEGEDEVTLKMIMDVQKKANQIIRDGSELEIFFVDKSELGKYGLKDNPKYSNPVRITNIKAINDYNACGCLHFNQIANVQAIIILGFENTNRGVKVNFTAGQALINYYSYMTYNMGEVYKLTKSNAQNVVTNVTNLLERSEQTQRDYNELKTKYYAKIFEDLLNTDEKFVIFDEVEDAKDLKGMTSFITRSEKDIVGLLQAHNGDSYSFVLAKSATSDYDLNALLTKLKADHEIRGGGKGQSVSGQSSTNISEVIKNYL